MKKSVKFALIILAIMLLAVPIGLLTDAPAFGEWDNSYYKKVLGFIPKGMEHFPNLQKPILPDYSISGANSVVGYYASALVGVALIFLVWFIIGKIIAKKSEHN